MTYFKNLNRIKIGIFFALLLSSVIWMTIEYNFASKEYAHYNILNIKVPQPELTVRLVKYLGNGLNDTLIRIFPKSSRQTKQQIPHLNVTFNSIFVELTHISPSTFNTFFIESKCATDKMTREYNTNSFILNARQCCSIESAARTNPERDIYILHTCPVSEDFLLGAPIYVQKLLLNHVNVHIVKYNMSEVFAGTPVQGLWRSRNVSSSKFPVEHSSDILRLTMLWRFGGMYCDLDVVTIRNVDLLHTNFCGLESDHLIGNAILNFEPSGYGHYLLTESLRYLNNHFNGVQWTANGPDLMTNVMLSACNTTMVKDLEFCTTFKIYNRDILYPLHWKDHRNMFESSLGQEMVKSLRKTGFTIHLWNKYTYKYKVQVGSSQGYSLLAEEFCPDVYNNCGDSF